MQSNIQPLRALLLLVSVCSLCICLGFIAKDEIRFSNGWELKFFTLQKYLQEEKPIDDPNIAFVNKLTESVEAFEASQEIEVDTITISSESDSLRPSKFAYSIENSETIGAVRQSILHQYDSGKSVLDNFFKALQNVPGSGEVIRVVHYGDSQIEGDRITSYIRKRLQARFGGCGVGLIPFKDRQGIRNTIQTQMSPNWERYAYVDSRKNPKDNLLGLLASKYSFTPTSSNSDDPLKYSWFKVLPPPYTQKKSEYVDQVKILFKTGNAPLAFEMSMNGDKVLFKKDIAAADSLQIFSYNLQQSYKNLDFHFGSKGHPEFFALALDGIEGVAVDNVPIRGSSGVEFSRMNRQFLKTMIQRMNVKLLIVQFGVNIVPSANASQSHYEKQFYRQLNYLKSLDPELDVLVVSVSDMSHRVGGNFQSYKNVVKIRNAQKEAARKAHCAFWDLYEAMGGENSMNSWVNANPALAGPDHTHFTPNGAKVAAEMLYNALMKEYETFKNSEL